MTAARLQVEPRLRIFHHKGAFIAGRLSGAGGWLPVAGPDLVLLSAFLPGATAEDAAQRLVEGPLGRRLPRIPLPQHVHERVAQLRQAGVLVEASGDPEPLTARTLADCAASPPADPRAIHRLGSAFLLRPVAGGFAIESPALRAEEVLDLDLALLLAGFTTGRAAAEVAAGLPGAPREEQMLRAVSWLARRKLLVPGREPETPVALSDGGATASARGTGWQAIEPDGRIPVYFVPHMENHYPLALGMIAAALRAHDDGALARRFLFLPISYMSPQELLQGPYRRFGPGVWLFSDYMWSLDTNLEVSAAVKRLDARNLTVHGGPSVPGYEQACRDFFARHSSVDIAVHGEGEVAAIELFERLQRGEDGRTVGDPVDLGAVAGLSYRDPADAGRVLRTPPRNRLRQLDSLPSPYLEGMFDDYGGRVEAAIVETNRGCPFACTFCDWGSATNGKIAKFEQGRVREEIEWIGRRQVRVLWIADANFGMFPADVEFAAWIVDVRRRYGYPREVVVNYTKNATRRLADIIRIFSAAGIVSQGIISIQTTDEETLRIIDRQNIKTTKYDELLGVFAEAGLPLSTDLMIGLPGATVASFAQDLQRYMDVDVSVKAYPTQLLPNSPMAAPDYRARYRIEVDEQDFVVACHSFSREDLARMKALNGVYVATEGYAVLRYVYRYLQWEHGLRAVDVMQRLIDQVASDPERYPAISWVLRFFGVHKRMPGGWRRFYDEVATFVRANWGIGRDSAFDVVLRVNELSMPDDTATYPVDADLEHDVVAWFRARNRREPVDVRPLADYPPGRISVDDPDGMVSVDPEFLQYDSHQYFWELRSPISRIRSAAGLVQFNPAVEPPAGSPAAPS